jgi:hypothetical protein
MSVKSSPSAGDNYHFYQEVFDEDNAYWIRVDGVEFEASPLSVAVRIPRDIMLKIAKAALAEDESRTRNSEV